MARPTSLEIVSELVANVLTIEVAEGDRVEAGDTVVLLESMKMEIPMLAERGHRRADPEHRHAEEEHGRRALIPAYVAVTAKFAAWLANR